MQRAVLAVTLAGVLLSHLPLAAGATLEPVTYRHQTQDLFPDDPHLDVALILSGTAYWRLEDGTVPAGGSATATLAPTPGPLDIDLQYRFRRACCAEQVVQGARTLHGDLPLEPLTLDDLEVGDRLAQLRLEGRLRAVAATDGPGDVEVPSEAWSGWDPQSLRVAADKAARPGEQVAVRVQTRYEWRIELRLDDGEAERRVEEGPAQAQGDALVEGTFDVTAPATAARAAQAVPALEGVAMLAAVLAGAAFTRWRRAP